MVDDNNGYEDSVGDVGDFDDVDDVDDVPVSTGSSTTLNVEYTRSLDFTVTCRFYDDRKVLLYQRYNEK